MNYGSSQSASESVSHSVKKSVSQSVRQPDFVEDLRERLYDEKVLKSCSSRCVVLFDILSLLFPIPFFVTGAVVADP